MSKATATTDHAVIKRWVEARRGRPAIVKATTRNKRPGGLLRIDYGPPEESLEQVQWDEFFEVFDQNQLVFLYQDRTASGRISRFQKFVSRDSIDESELQESSGKQARDDDESSSTQRRAGNGSGNSSDSRKSAAKSAGSSKHQARPEDEDSDEEEDAEVDEEEDFDEDDADEDEDSDEDEDEDVDEDDDDEADDEDEDDDDDDDDDK